MPAPAARHSFEWDDVGDVTVVRFTVRSIREQDHIQRIFDNLQRLVDDNGRHRLVLDFSMVDFFASYTIGKLIGLKNKLAAAGGRLALCNLTPPVAEIISIMRLERQFHIYATEQEALQSF